MSLYLTFNSSNLEEKAKKLSIDLQLQIIDKQLISIENDKYYLFSYDYFQACFAFQNRGWQWQLDWHAIEWHAIPMACHNGIEKVWQKFHR